MRRPVLAAPTTLVLAVLLAACTTSAETPDKPSTPMPVPTSSASASAAPPAAPTLNPAGTAAENQAFFDATMATLLASNSSPDGRTIIDTLVGAGFDKAAMEVTPDSTAIGLDADSVQFTVKFADACIVGQQGNVGYHSAVLPVLSTGKCLIGQTRTINW